MGTIKDMLKRATAARNNFDSDLKLAVQLVSDDLIRLKQDELFEGIGNDGNIIGVYSRGTESMTKGLTGVGYPKRAGDPFNFYAEGNLFKSWKYIFKDNSSLELVASDAKYDELKRRYPKMVGLSTEGQMEFNYNLLLNAIRGTTGRHFLP